MHPAELREAPDNPREIRPERFEALKFAMSADPSMMDARPVILDARRGDVVCGNMRLRAALALGWDSVPVYAKEFESDAQRREWMIRDNNGYGDWVPDELAALVEQQASEGADLRLLGFSEQELSDLRAIAGHDEPPEPDAPEDDLPSVWGVVVDCEDAEQQAALLEELADRGLNVRALMVQMMCPRCGQATLALRPQAIQNRTRHPAYDRACTNPDCNWPDPEPGLISLLRVRHGQSADAILQQMRAAGTWPPVP